ncbi:MAG: hypothetical protein JJ863_19265 [Deltaproteobacteria bacterium]|nr:hypothetical protein [Deltaproteobacteria bacterium]
MARFFAGFAVASILWGAGVWAWTEGLIGQSEVVVEPEPVAEAPEEVVEEEEAPTKRGRRRRRPRRGMGAAALPTGTATTGDNLGENDPRELAAGENGGEQQLTQGQIESAMDGGFGAIRRCLVLVPGDAPVTGRLTFGLRIAGSGQVQRVNLRGPAVVTQGEPGDCLRTAARRIRFPSFDGPEMIVHYPITLE